jgi:hypothetical protein
VSVLRKLFLGLVVLVVAASDLAQLGLIGLLMEYSELSGERRGYAGMGLIKVMGPALLLIVPGALLALFATVTAIVRRRAHGVGGTASLVFFGGSTALSLIFIAVFVYVG